MRRLLSGPAGYLADLARATVRGWNDFFFSPADPTPLGLIRIAVGLLLFWNLWILGLDLHAFLGSSGWADPAALRQVLEEQSSWAWSFWLWVPDGMLRAAWVVCLIVLAMFTLGLASRTTSALAWIIAVSTSNRVPVIQYGFDDVVATWALYLAVSGASGQAVSLDRFLKRWRRARADLARRRRDGAWVVPPGAPTPTVSANLGLRLIQLHLVLIYGAAGVAKLLGPSWWEGSALWSVISVAEFRRFDLTWLASYPYLLNALTHGALLLEVIYPILIWIRRLRPLLIASAVLMHVGIDLSLGLTEFGLVMIAANLSFVPGPWLRGLVTGREQPSGRVLYDGACPRCRASIALVAAADPDRVVEPIDLTTVDVATVHPGLTRADCLRSMHLVRADGRIAAGFDAVRTLALWLPLGWPLGVLGSLPGVARVGRRAYNALAAGRPRDVPCTDESCSIHPRAARRAKVDEPSAPAGPGRTSR